MQLIWFVKRENSDQVASSEPSKNLDWPYFLLKRTDYCVFVVVSISMSYYWSLFLILFQFYLNSYLFIRSSFTFRQKCCTCMIMRESNWRQCIDNQIIILFEWSVRNEKNNNISWEKIAAHSFRFRKLQLQICVKIAYCYFYS